MIFETQTMGARRVQLFGPVQVLHDTASVPRFRSQRAIALLGYLVSEQRAIARDVLAVLLYPDESLSKGRGSLRRDLHNLNQILPDCWDTVRASVCFVPRSNVTVDVQRVQQLEDATEWESAAKLMRGDFLEGLYLDDSPEFETWLHGERERWRLRAERVLSQAIKQLEQQGNFDQAIGHAQRLVQQMPWQEEAHRRLMQLLALSGRRSEALRQFERCKQALVDELDVEVSTETLALYERIQHSPRFSPNTIPALVTPLVGRERELSAITEMVVDPEIRLITITGMGGIGKTHLALGVAWQLATGFFRDGVTFVPLAAEETAEQTLSALAQAHFLPSQAQQPRPLRQQLADYLRDRESLLVLDNCEHLLDELEFVAHLLRESPRLCILATTRIPLQLHGEHQFAIQGLARADENTEHAAARLFTAAARRRDPGFSIHDQNAPYVNQICRLVDGIPLGLELAASWVDALPLSDIAGEIQQNVDFLETDARDVPARHRSIRAVFNHSWQRMGMDEQVTFAQLSVFRDSFTRHAAQKITGASLRNLSQLTVKSLLQFDRESERYMTHELVRQYAAERLTAHASDAKGVHARHSAFFLDRLHHLGTALRSNEQLTALAEIETEYENVRLAWEWSAEHEDLARLERALESLGKFHEWFGRFQAGEAACRIAIAAVRRESNQLLVRLLTWQASFCYWQGKSEEATFLLNRSLNLLDEAELAAQDMRSERAAALLLLGMLNLDAVDRSDYEQVMINLNRCLELYQELDDPRGMAQALVYMCRSARLTRAGTQEQFRQRLEEGNQLGKQCIAICRRVGDRATSAQALIQICINLVLLGQLDDAFATSQEAVALTRTFGLEANLVHAANAQGWTSVIMGNYEQARRDLGFALELARDLGYSHELSGATQFTAWIDLAQGRYHAARQCFHDLMERRILEGSQFQQFIALVYLSVAEYYVENLEEARRRFIECLRLALDTRAYMLVYYALPVAALLLTQCGEYKRALAFYGSITHFHREHEHPFYRDIAGNHIREAAASSLSRKEIAVWEAKGRQLDLWTELERLWEELNLSPRHADA